MSSTLASLTLALARAIATVKSGTATGGSTTTLIDTGFYNPEVADYWKWGTIWFQSGNNVGKSAIITASTLTTPTFTFGTQSGACAAGNLYSVTHRDFPRWQLRQAVNRALQEIGNAPATNTALVTVGSQEEYSLPTGVTNVTKVEQATNTATPYEYITLANWRVRESKLVFETGFAPGTAGLTLRLTYANLGFTELDDDTDAISDLIHEDLVTWLAAVHALTWRMTATQEARTDILALLANAQQKAAECKARYMPVVERERRHTIRPSKW